MAAPARIDLNSDLGEGFGRWSLGDDTALLDVVTSANVACGFHAGDPPTLRRVCAGAAERSVVVGAQVSYHDLAGFGRRAMDVPPAELRDEVIYQIAALDGICGVVGTTVAYVKPHGALYNRCFTDTVQAQAVVAAVVDYNPDLAILGQPGSALLKAAEQAGLQTATEAFADRAYTPSGLLVARTEPGSVIHDPAEVTHRVTTLARTGTITAIDGSVVAVSARSVCVHGDTPGAPTLARQLREALAAAGIEVAPFIGP